MTTSSTPIAIVGVTETCERLRAFDGPDALPQAEKYVGTLPGVETGRYYIDYPCSRELLAEVPTGAIAALKEAYEQDPAALEQRLRRLRDDNFEIDFPDGSAHAYSTLEDAIEAAQNFVEEQPATLRVFKDDKAVALVTPTTVQTLDTDPGF